MSILSNLNLDFQSIYEDVQTYIESNQEIGSALFPSDTTKALTELVAGLHAHINYRLETWTKNAFLPGASSKSAIYDLAVTLGSPPRRKVGASMDIEIQLSSLSQDITIPKNSIFSCRDLLWYTRNEVVIPAGQTSFSLTIYQGELITETFTSDGSNFQLFSLKEGSFNIDDNYLYININNEEWIRERKSLIFYKEKTSSEANVFKETSNSDGTVSILFGNGTFGNIPASNNTITVTYSKTSGLSSNSNNTGDSVELITEILLLDNSTFSPTSIKTTSKATSGDNEESPEAVKYTSPRLFAANNRAVTRSDYEGYIKKYPGVAVVKVWGEAEESERIGKNDASIRNKLFFSALKNSTENKSGTYGEIESGISEYSFTLPDSDILKGSLIINIDDKLKYYDIGGLIVCDDVSNNSLTGGTANTNSEDPMNPAENAFDENISYYSSARAPEYTDPVYISYDMGLGNEIDFASIRFQAASLSDYNNRACLKTINISASNESSPSIINDSDWTVLKGNTTIEDLDSQQFSDWIYLNTYPTTYRHLRIKIYDRYGTSDSVKIGNIELQKKEDISSIDYTNSSVDLKVDLSKVSVGDSIDYKYTISDYSSSEIDDIITYMDDYKFMNCTLSFVNPIIKSVDIEIEAYYKNSSIDINSLYSQISTAISNIFSISQNSIGKEIKLSDIVSSVISNTNIDWCNMITPKTNIIVNKNEILQIGNLTIKLYKTSRV